MCDLHLDRPSTPYPLPFNNDAPHGDPERRFLGGQPPSYFGNQDCNGGWEQRPYWYADNPQLLHQRDHLRFIRPDVQARDGLDRQIVDQDKAIKDKQKQVDKLQLQVNGAKNKSTDLKKFLADLATATKERDNLQTKKNELVAQRSVIDSRLATQRQGCYGMPPDPATCAELDQQLEGINEELRFRGVGQGWGERTHQWKEGANRLISQLLDRLRNAFSDNGYSIALNTKHFGFSLNFPGNSNDRRWTLFS